MYVTRKIGDTCRDVKENIHKSFYNITHNFSAFHMEIKKNEQPKTCLLIEREGSVKFFSLWLTSSKH